MRQPPFYTCWKITCHSREEAASLQRWLARRIDLDRALTDTIRTVVNEVEREESVSHRLGDYFANIRMVPASASAPSFRLVFHRLADAGRFWKDLMVNILQEIEATPQKPSVTLDYKGNEEAAAVAVNW